MRCVHCVCVPAAETRFNFYMDHQVPVIVIYGYIVLALAGRAGGDNTG